MVFSLISQNLPNMNYLPTCTSRLVVQHPCKKELRRQTLMGQNDGMREGRNDGQSKHLMPSCHFMVGA